MTKIAFIKEFMADRVLGFEFWVFQNGGLRLTVGDPNIQIIPSTDFGKLKTQNPKPKTLMRMLLLQLRKLLRCH